MFNKINTKRLAGIFGILLLISVFVIIRDKSGSTASKNRSFKAELVEFDSAKVTQISIQPKFEGAAITLIKKEDSWKVLIDEKEYSADQNTVGGMLSNLLALRATRMAANNKEQWAKYEVIDSLATRVTISTGRKTVTDIYLGKFSYKQAQNQNPYANSGRQPQGTMTSYVRLEGDKQVFAVDGMVAISFNRQANDFRDRTLIRSDINDWNLISVNSPEESYTISKHGNNWMIDGLVADSTLLSDYLKSMAYLNSPDFIEESDKLSDEAVYELSIEGENISAPIRLKAFPADTTNAYAISSSMNEGSWFSGKKSGLIEKIIKPKNHFFPENIEVVE